MQAWMNDRLKNHLLGFFSVITYYNEKRYGQEAILLSTHYVLIVQEIREKIKNIQTHSLSL